MAVGDATDMLARLRSNLPRWFPDSGRAPIVDGTLSGIAASAARTYALITFAKQQMRLATVSGGWLDLWAWDYLGSRVTRKAIETDAAYSQRVKLELVRSRATRNGLIQALIDLTGIAPAVFEPSNPSDTGGYSQPGYLAYGLVGGYGSMLLPWQAFIGAFRPTQSGIPNVIGYGSPAGGYSQSSQIEYGNLSQVIGPVTDADISAMIDAVRPTDAVLTVGISNVVTLVPLTNEAGVILTDEGGNTLYLD